MGRIERANDNAAYDKSRSVDAVAGDSGMRRNTPGTRGRRGPTHAGGQPECVAHNNRQTMVVKGGR